VSTGAPAGPAQPVSEQAAATSGTPISHASLLSDSTLSMVGAVGGTLLSGIASILIARGLGVTARGRWAVISSLAVVVATIAATGLPAASAYAAARLRGADREGLVRSALTATAASAALAAVAYLVAAVIVRPPASSTAVALGCAIPLASVAYAVTHQLTLTIASMRWFALAQVVGAAISLIAVVALDVAGVLTVLSVVAVSAGGAAVGTAICLQALRRHRAFGPDRPLVAPVIAAQTLRPYVAYAMVTFAVLSLTTIVQRVDVLLVNGFKGPHAAGLYAVAEQLTDLMLVVPAALGLVMFRRGARSVPNHYADAVSVLRWMGIFAIVAAVFALAIAGWIIPFVLGSHYRGSVDPLRLLLLGTVAFSLQSVLSQYLAGRGRPRIVLIAWGIGAVVGVAADLVVIPRYGIDGAAVVSSFSYLIVTGLHVRAMRSLRPSPATR
jgi:O-antigen/teichoic acid export membrane protein